MQLRQIVTVVIGLIVIVGAALFVVSWGGDGDGDAATADDTGDDDAGDDDPASGDDTGSDDDAPADDTTTTTTTTLPPPCTADAAGAATADGSAGGGGGAAEAQEPPETTVPETTVPETTDPAEPVEPTLGRNSSVSTVGLDTVTFGLTVLQAEQAAGTELVPCDPVGDCYRVAPVEAPEGIVFVVTEGTIERVDIVGGPITTRSGLGIGTDEARIVELFGDSLEREVNDDGSVDLVFVPTSETDAQFRVIFTIRDGVVDAFRSGRLPMVLPDIPCA